MNQLQFTEAGSKSNKGEWLLRSSYLKVDMCRGHMNSEDKCKNGWGKKSIALEIEAWQTNTVMSH